MSQVKTPAEIIKEITKKDPAEEYNLIYDSTSETLEPVYFWVLDFMNPLFGGNVQKLVDNFASSPGSGHFSELMAKGTKMQEEAMKIMQTVGILIKSLINIVYDLRQFEMALNDYKEARSNDKSKSGAALLALKQKWLDNVDIKRGNTSIKAMAFSQASFATLIDAFMVVDSVDGIKKIDLNDRVKRILEQRVLEFSKWKELSEKEMQKRYHIEKSWLKNQVASLKLYSRWAKPYLKAAEELMMVEPKSAALVKAFNTITLQLTLFGKKKIDVVDSAQNSELPEDFAKIKFKRDYYYCVLVDLNFRGIPQRAGQHYVFGGRAEVSFKAYTLNDDEIKLLERKLEESDLADALTLVETATTETLGEIKDDLDYFLKDEEERESEESEKASEQDINPFTSLIGMGIKKTKKEKEKKGEEEKEYIGSTGKELKEPKDIKKDNYAESVIRKYAGKKAEETCFTIYDTYKKSHNMASSPDRV